MDSIDYSKQRLTTDGYDSSKDLEYLCVYDLECNCSKDRKGILFNECIELPVVVLDLKTNKFVGEFQTYVRPEVDPALKAFCTELTGITNEMAFTNSKTGQPNPTFSEAMQQLHAFLVSTGIINKNFVLCSCGDFDGK